MAAPPSHHIVATGAHRVPRPFRSLALRGDEPGRTALARAPWNQLHVVRTSSIQADALHRVAAEGRARTRLKAFGDIAHARTSLKRLDAIARLASGWGDVLAGALGTTRVLGDGSAGYRHCLARRIDHLATCGAGFHNDVRGHWSRCLFWLLALDADDVELVLPHAGVRLPLSPGDLVVFDPAMAHGLCRPADQGQALAASFEGRALCSQHFLTGELPLSDTQWAALGAPWLPLAVHRQHGALDLRVAEFDERSGSVQRVLALRDALQEDPCEHVEADLGAHEAGDDGEDAAPSASSTCHAP